MCLVVSMYAICVAAFIPKAIVIKFVVSGYELSCGWAVLFNVIISGDLPILINLVRTKQ